MGLQTATQAQPAAVIARRKIVDAFARMFAKAKAEKVLCYRHLAADGSWDGTGDVPSSSTPGQFYNVRHNGSADWADISCPCDAGKHGTVCKHASVYAFARAHHVWAVRRCPACDPRFCSGNCPDVPALLQFVVKDSPEWSELPYEAPAAEDVIWDAEATLADDRYEQRLAEQLAESSHDTAEEPPYAEQGRASEGQSFGPDPVHERQVALGRQRPNLAASRLPVANDPLAGMWV